ncbi:MAG: hypothetical protein IPP10_05195 [Candidatus Competibacteraceae bacterium]|nr:hypothetical protein [Candidatus Competibacteraceae bacterium]MBK7983562.1 hypothetical protein [Candidatus Competibacteraceae bacterium]MBK8897898.1 hypothetical protein [Candidatus Competibacteraceae bacterium]MBK8961701.1 hypothetical protein [Candidatus Competibacteraceae bacterium]MBK9950920.1 hypothetical protein [Candidatus Competibacteraceae bacterium]
MSRRFDPLLVRLLLGGALCLPACLGLWWWLVREPLARELGHGVGLLSQWLWPESVLGVGLDRDQGLIVSLLPPLTDSARLFMALPLPFNRATVILPLFWGLTLATPGRGLSRRLLYGTLALLPVICIMVLLYVQFQLALYRTHLPLLTELPPPDYALALPDSPVLYQLWGLGRQLAMLVLPIVAPLLAWLLLHQPYLRGVILGALMQRATGEAPRREPPAAPPPDSMG